MAQCAHVCVCACICVRVCVCVCDHHFLLHPFCRMHSVFEPHDSRDKRQKKPQTKECTTSDWRDRQFSGVAGISNLSKSSTTQWFQVILGTPSSVQKTLSALLQVFRKHTQYSFKCSGNTQHSFKCSGNIFSAPSSVHETHSALLFSTPSRVQETHSALLQVFRKHT